MNRHRIEIEFDATIDGAEDFNAHLGVYIRALASWDDTVQRVTVSMTPVVDPPK